VIKRYRETAANIPPSIEFATNIVTSDITMPNSVANTHNIQPMVAATD
jgi:hypothetical protein